MPTGIELIAEERDRQIFTLNYDLEHDREHEESTLAFAAACYAAPATIHLVQVADGQVRWVEPWPSGWQRKTRVVARDGSMDAEDRLRELAKAGALIAAEMDRILADDDAQA